MMNGRRPLLRLLLATTALSGLAATQALAQSLPTGASVAYGGVTFGKSSGTLTINQSSQNAIVNYNSFSIGQRNTVTINQPNSASVILNRVTGSTPSTIAGHLNANGQVYLINPNGIAITKTGVVKVGGGFVASSLGMSDYEFKHGRKHFKGNGSSASVTNAGTITIGRGGYAALIGGTVRNSGTISVPMGKVALGSGEMATLDVSGDGFLQVALPTTSGGKGALVSNSGLIAAAGGTVVLDAATARAAARNAINISGTIDAHSISGHNGSIVLGGGDGGAINVSGMLNVSGGSRTAGGSVMVTGRRIKVSGTIQASGRSGGTVTLAAANGTTITGRVKAIGRHGKGGAVTVTGLKIAFKGASVDASGATGGGSVRIGGNEHGAGPLPNAGTVTIDARSVITADATTSGNGGSVVVWSDLSTSFAGTISAKGGAAGGDGGSAEVSSKGVLDYTGLTTLTAAKGANGTLLLDPYNVTISNGAGTSGFTASGNGSVINVTTLQNALASANVTVSTGTAGTQAGNITVASAFGWSSGSLLTLTAANAIAINAPITISGAGKLALNAATTTVGSTTQPLLSFGNGASVSYTGAEGAGQALTINGTAYTLVYTVAELSALTGGADALAVNLTPTASYTAAVVPTFSGTLEGLGHTVTGLTIASTGNNVGLIGTLNIGGTARDIGLVGGSVGGANTVGGLVGINLGTITQAYATGAVGGSQFVGGLVGVHIGGTITQAYATGAVSGSQFVGGLVGDNEGTITASAFDTSTTGQTAGVGQQGGSGTPTALTTAQLQGTSTPAAANPFGATTALAGGAAGGEAGVYPYLTSFFPNGVQAVSGMAYSNAAGTVALASTAAGAVVVTLDANGGRLGQATTGANGYYYLAVPAGTLAAGSTLLASTPANTATGATNGATLTSATGVAGQQGGVNLFGNTLTIPTTSLTLSGAPTLASATAAAGSDTAAAAVVAATGGIGYLAQGASFTIDQAVTTAKGFAVTTLAGDPLTVAAPITIQSGGALGLTSGGTLAIDAAVTAQGAVPVTLAYNTAAVTNLSFAQGAALTYTDASGNPVAASQGGTLTINGNAYTLLYTLANAGSTGPDTGTSDVAGIDNAGDGGRYALASNLVGTGTAQNPQFTAALAGSGNNTFTGTFEGLGHTISNLTITSGATYAGLFGLVGRGGTVRDVGLVGGSVTDTAGAEVGGLVGLNDGTVTQSYSTGAVSGGSYATGGLVGYNDGTVTQSYNTGAVSGGSGAIVGGLVGINGGTVTQSYSTGAVSGGSGATVGGLVGINVLGTVTQSYSTGAVSGGSGATVGGLVGFNGGTVTQSYSTGAVSGGSGATVGGLVGENDGPLTNSYFDTATSGTTTGVGIGSASGVTGLTTAALQSTATTGVALGTAFSGGAAGGENGVYPYLTAFFPNGVQAVSGLAYKDNGTTLLTSAPGVAGNTGSAGNPGIVSVAAGTAVLGSVTTGANGYYYYAAPAGTFVAGTPVEAFTLANAASGAVKAVSYTLAGAATTTPSTTSVAGLNIYGGQANFYTPATTYSVAAPAAQAALASAEAANPQVTSLVAGLTPGLVGTGASFTLDQTVDATTGLALRTVSAAAPLTIAMPLTVESGTALDLAAAGVLRVDAPITAKGAVTVALAYDTNTTTPAVTDFGFAQGDAITYTDAHGNAVTTPVTGQALTINGTAYTLIYNMAELDGIDGTAASGTAAPQYGPGLAGAYALATPLNAAGTTYTTSLVAQGTTNSAGTSFSGTLEGLGQTISGLTIVGSALGTGLIGSLNGTARDIGLVGGSVSGSQFVGGLVGFNLGTITQAYATGAVGGGQAVGGLVGDNQGTITQAYATGAVSGSQFVGGLVGYNDGTITQAYATGAVGGGQAVGGLVGFNDGGTITQAYATGAVSGSQFVGGLVGLNDGTITASAFDTSTTGQTAGVGQQLGSGNPTPLTTAQLQGTSTPAAANPFGATTALAGGAAGGEAGVYPYLTSFFPNGVQAVSGMAYKDNGTTLLTSPASSTTVATTRPGLVTVVAGGQALGTSTTGANGYYYVFSPLGSVAAGAGVVAYTAADPAVTIVNGLGGSGAANAASFTQSPGTASNTNLPVYGTWLAQQAGTLASLSTLNAAYATAIGATAPSGFTLANREIDAPGAFTLDQLITQTGTLVLTSPGAVTQTAGTINAASLVLGGTGGFTLTAANSVATIAANTGSVSFTDTAALATGSVTNDVSAATAGVTTTGAVTLASGGSITIAAGAPVSGTSPVLAATGTFVNQDGANAVTALNGTRWLVYSSAPGADTFGPNANAYLNSGNTAVYGTASGGAVNVGGDRYVFASTATLTVTTTSDAKTYGTDITARVAGDFTITGLQGGVTGAYLADTAATAYSGTPGVTSAGSAATAGVAGSPYAINATQGSLSSQTGYAFAFANAGTVTVSPLAVTVVGTQVYNGTTNTPGAGLTVTNAVNGDTIALAGTGTLAAKNAGAEALTSTGGALAGLMVSNANYTVTGGSGTVTVSPLAVILSGTQVYTGTTAAPAAGLSVTNMVAGDAVGLAGTGTLASKNAGAEALTSTSGALAGLNVSNGNYTVTGGSGTVNVTAASLTYVANAATSTYGAAPTGLGGTVTGFVGGQTQASATTGTATFATAATGASNVGSYAITGSGLTANNGNYVFTQAAANATALTVNPALLSVSGVKTYDATTGFATGQLAVAGAQNGETVMLTQGSGTASSANAATYAGSSLSNLAVSVTGGNAMASNYALPAAGTLTIGQATITVAGATGINKTYDATTALPNGATGFTTSGVIGNNATVAATSAQYASANAGVEPVTVAGLTISGAGAGNYVLSSTSVTGSGTITPASLTYVANAATSTYGAASTGLGGTVTGFVGGQTQASATTGTATFATAATGASNVGSYAITGSGLTANNGNYVFTQAAANATALTVNPALLSVSGVKTYDATTGFATGQLAVAGAQNGETVMLTQGSGTASSANAATYAGSSLSNLAVSVTGGNAMASNYALPAAGTLTIGQATITVAGATGINKTYDATTALPNGATGFTTSGVIGNNATVAATSAQYASANAGVEPVTVAGLTISGAGAGNYVLSSTSVTGSGTITPAPVTVTANGGGSIYGQTPANPNLSATGLQGGQSVVLLTGLSNSFGITGQSNAGAYTLTVQGTLTNANYTVAAANKGTFTVAQRALAIGAENQERAANTDNPPLSYQIGATTQTTGLVNGDGLTGALTTSATTASAAGFYTIGQGTIVASSNYVVSYTPGTLTIEPAAVMPVLPTSVSPTPEPTPMADLSGTLLASTANRAFEQIDGDLGDALPFVFSSLSGGGSYASQLVAGLGNPRFDRIIVCVRDVCTLVPPIEGELRKTSQLETPVP